MASTYSTDLKIELIATGEQVGTWGSTTNTNLGTALEQAIVGRANVVFGSDANKTLTLTNSNAAQDARALFLNVTSSVSLSATRDLVVPALSKNFIVKNGTSGSQSIRVIVAGTGVTIPNGKTALVYNDGTNVGYQLDHAGSLDLSGALVVAGTSTLGGNTSITGNVSATGTAGFGNTTVTGTLAVTGDATFSGTGQIKLPAGTTAQRSGSPSNGMIRYNTTLSQVEVYFNSQWNAVSFSSGVNANILNATGTASSTGIVRLFEDTNNGTNYVDIVPPTSIASNRTITLPDATTTMVGTNTTQTLTNKTLGSGLVMGATTLTAGTMISASSQTSMAFTGIPSWVKKITICFDGISLSGSAQLLIQIGDSGGLETSGYQSQSNVVVAATGFSGTTSTSGFVIVMGNAAYVCSGALTLTNLNGNSWVSSGCTTVSTSTTAFSAGSKTLSATIDRVTITTSNGTDTFDAGSVNILYE